MPGSSPCGIHTRTGRGVGAPHGSVNVNGERTLNYFEINPDITIITQMRMHLGTERRSRRCRYHLRLVWECRPIPEAGRAGKRGGGLRLRRHARWCTRRTRWWGARDSTGHPSPPRDAFPRGDTRRRLIAPRRIRCRRHRGDVCRTLRWVILPVPYNFVQSHPPPLDRETRSIDFRAVVKILRDTVFTIYLRLRELNVHPS